MIVVDASVLAPIVADGETDGEQYRHRVRGERLCGPDLLRVEVVSVIQRQLAIGTLSLEQADQAVNDLVELPITVYPVSPLVPRAWELRENVTAYDACYVALAEALDCTLLTADLRLSRAPGVRCAIEAP